LVEERRHGHDRLERPPYLLVDFHSHANVRRSARERVSFNQLHNVCHLRLKQPLFCPVLQPQRGRSEIVKGHEYAKKDQYVLFSEEELDKIEPSSAKVMEIWSS